QRCQTHFICNILDAAPKYMQDALLEEIRGILHAPNKQTARLLLEQVLAKRKFIRAWKNDSPLS
ncbi:transposase, partial [Parageobacillus thermoglucosidasius]|uniref:transposase n=1 Tax=Parageobacillus thermoglucosidasius TaxID=1426 RepID=UPI002E1D4EFF